ncbi:MAG: hypothetical protein WKG07_13060 [Hymenobacter sp.]
MPKRRELREKLVADLQLRRPGRTQIRLQAARLADFPATRYRGCADPDRPLPEVRPGEAVPERPAAGRAAGNRGTTCPTADGRSPLARAEAFVKTSCPHVRRARPSARPTRWILSPIRAGTFCATLRRARPRRRSTRRPLERWLPVDTYVGGADDAVLPDFAVFWMALADLEACHCRGRLVACCRRHGPGVRQPQDEQIEGNVVSPDAIITAFSASSLRT